MDRIDALVAVAHVRLRLELILRYPYLLEGTTMALKIRKPIELAGLSTRMIRAEAHEKMIAELGRRYDGVQDRIDELVSAHTEHAGALEEYEKKLRDKIEAMVGSNGGDPLDDGETGQETGQLSGGQVISSETSK